MANTVATTSLRLGPWEMAAFGESLPKPISTGTGTNGAHFCRSRSTAKQHQGGSLRNAVPQDAPVVSDAVPSSRRNRLAALRFLAAPRRGGLLCRDRVSRPLVLVLGCE
jgi:hypothetical protein